MLIDSHTHFDLMIEDKVATEDSLINSLSQNQIEYIVQIAIDESNLLWSREFALKYKDRGVFYTLGIHPSSNADEVVLKKLSSIVEEDASSSHRNLIFGIGECGLDFYRMRQSEDMQRSSFEYQIDLALKYDLPLIVHLRDALDEGYEIIKRKSISKGVMHCFPGDSSWAKKFLDLGFYISFAGNLTYKKAVELHDALAYVPLDRIFFETDAPFLTPVPLRGKPNLPEYISYTYKFAADMRKIPLHSLEDKVAENFSRLVSL